MAGKLIVFEGVEGSGKSTQIKSVEKWLQSLPSIMPSSVIVTSEPGGTKLGKELRQLLLAKIGGNLSSSSELLLYVADRAQHVEEVLKPALAEGKIVLCDRYTDSTIAYQGYGRGLSLSLIEQLNSIATGGLKSDLTLWLDVDVEVGLARTDRRGIADRIEQEPIDFHQRVKKGYEELAIAYPERIVRIDASLSEEEVQEQIQTILHQKLIPI